MHLVSVVELSESKLKERPEWRMPEKARERERNVKRDERNSKEIVLWPIRARRLEVRQNL